MLSVLERAKLCYPHEIARQIYDKTMLFVSYNDVGLMLIVVKKTIYIISLIGTSLHSLCIVKLHSLLIGVSYASVSASSEEHDSMSRFFIFVIHN